MAHLLSCRLLDEACTADDSDRAGKGMRPQMGEHCVKDTTEEDLTSNQKEKKDNIETKCKTSFWMSLTKNVSSKPCKKTILFQNYNRLLQGKHISL